ncbi:hypothetical protein MLD38_035900 [Melastoma candidum]|uniref:Uncharacterized protein n=1 Tax=Melastoma candidum TaxID=119954 RepID=A0ACB9LIY1_9MYRT|nr:hypothetical protein MLD38_035900 [Melastoma candidum]
MEGDSQEEADSPNVFSVRIVSIDYYMAPPVPEVDVCYSSFHGEKVNEVPVIRIYGSTPAGKKMCLHVHQVFPYLHVPCSDIPLDGDLKGNGYTHAVSLALEKALNLKAKAGVKRQHVHGCNLVRARRFYGYHMSEELFVKIHLYNPHDVRRAAKLLLGGVVFDQFVQPHESHIPYLLQFLVDYNLYGMGHIHLLKIKFRLPLPDTFSVEKLNECIIQADKVHAVRWQTPPAQTSTMVTGAGDQIGGSPGDSYSLTQEFIQGVQRQSTCELEGDAVVFDIVNQNNKLYTSLSQARSDVKMVQSLVPIWEEELERSGMHSVSLTPDPGKPCAEDVLRVLSFGLDLEGKLAEFYVGSEQPTSSLERKSNHINPNTSSASPSEKAVAATPDEDRDPSDLLKVSPSCMLQYGLPENHMKRTDKEAIGLLKWLASSQAADEINSDDELTQEIILSPLLPENNINKMLEKANMDYESESQKECQDILDTMVATIAAGSKDVSNYNHTTPEKRIQQVDGTSDDIGPSGNMNLAGSSSSSIEKSINKKSTPNQSLHIIGKSSTKKQGSKRLLWGKLPLSMLPVDTSDGKLKNSMTDHLCLSDTEDVNIEISPHVGHSSEKEEKAAPHLQEGSELRTCSLREMMRRKRNLHFEGSDSLCCNESDTSKPDGLCSARKTNSSDTYDQSVESSNCLEDVKAVNLSGEGNIVTARTVPTPECGSSAEFVLGALEHPVADSKKDELGDADLIRTPGLSPKYTGDMTISEKPDTSGLERAALENSPHTEAEKDHFQLAQEGYGDEEDSDGVIPFFRQPRDENKPVQCDGSVVTNCFPQNYATGVPVHYLNDGSHLFLLTPVTSPPTADIVEKWLLSDDGVGPCHSVIPVSCKSSPDDSSGCRPETDSKLNEVLLEDSKKHRQESNDKAVGQPVSQYRSSEDSLQDVSQISGPVKRSGATPLSQIGFRDPASAGAGQQLTLLSIEVLADARGDLQPNPRFDSINILALAISNDSDSATESYALMRSDSQSPQRSRDGLCACKVIEFTEEKHLVIYFVEFVSRHDPDILIGWDVQGGSLGFLAERASFLGIGLLNKISRVPTESKDAAGELGPDYHDELLNRINEALKGDFILSQDAFIEDEWGRTHASGVHVGGRIVLNGWRLIRGELKLNMYSVEAVADAVLRRRVPSFPTSVLTKWFNSGPGKARYRCLEHIIERAKLNLLIVEQLDLINRTSELARVFGIDFFSVLSRGSQYRVESMLLRLAHTQNYIAISPGNEQVASQPAMECLPLVMEPESGFYVDPVVVLDFQSLYPSMIIAYNLCFCTCLGKIAPSKQNVLGVSTFSPDAHVIHRLKDELLLTPNGAMYVPPTVRKGILPRLLEEILSTRIMVKQAMKKLTPAQRVLSRIFNARQLALKLIANVTYGYTAAGFSGRMPCAELADSIVQCGRRTLENAISFVNSHDKWKAKVVYGDTDSMFVLLKGRTVNEAFQIGQEIAAVITGMNPNPVVLKMEKVYQPCFLLTKKRYVGYSYENPEQTQPLFDAKGIETVRRDTCAAVAKTMEQSLRLYFESQDIGKVKAYLYRQWSRILSGRISVQDFVFAKEVRLGTYSTRQSASLPPAAIVATKAMRKDPRAEPRYGERIPYVVVHGEPGSRLVDMVVDPMEVLRIDSPLRLNELYYIGKQIIPSLQRVFSLVGADLNRWFAEMPRPMREIVRKHSYNSPNAKRTRIDSYYLSNHCIICGDLVPSLVHICNKCSCNSAAVASYVTGKTSRVEEEMHHLAAICRHCGGGDWIVESGVKCTSLACPVFYERRKVQKELRGFSGVAAEQGFYPKCTAEWF